VSASEDLNEMADVIHDALGDLCCGVEDADPDRVLCFEIAEALVATGFGQVC
jgi:hypothetical protein